MDFLARAPEGAEELIQVAAAVDDPTTLARELRALESAAREHPHATRHLVTLRPETVREVPAGIEVHAAAGWLLG